jgi:peptidoglycan/xylan/chitin deacetylase (PgdA/CDA1 family)
MRCFGLVGCVAMVICCATGSVAIAEEEACPGKPDAIGTSRTITVDPAVSPRVGSMHYRGSLPLNDHEVVITLDDGPIPPYTTRILDILKENCVRATYFLVGQMASAYPSLVRRIYNDGHTVGTHSHSHPLAFQRIGNDRIKREVDKGIESVKAAIGDPRAVAPYFRIPGLAQSKRVEAFLDTQLLTVWSADEVADDWLGISAESIVRRAIRRIEAKDHRGVLLLHDIHPATARALPSLLKELKSRGYRIVHAVPPGERPASVPELPPVQVAKADDAEVKPTPRRTRRRRASRNDDSFITALSGKKRITNNAASLSGTTAANY